jgi:sirohydrochlorin ferrochelatase
MQALIAAGYNPTVSSRGYGSLVKNSEGIDVVQDDYICEGWDVVMTPSFSNAIVQPVGESKKISKLPSTSVVESSIDGAKTPVAKQTPKNTMDANQIRQSLQSFAGLEVSKLTPQRYAEGMRHMEGLHQHVETWCSEDTANRRWDGTRLHEEITAIQNTWSSAIAAPTAQVERLSVEKQKLLSVTEKIVQTGVALKNKLKESLDANTKLMDINQRNLARGRAWKEFAEGVQADQGQPLGGVDRRGYAGLYRLPRRVGQSSCGGRLSVDRLRAVHRETGRGCGPAQWTLAGSVQDRVRFARLMIMSMVLTAHGSADPRSSATTHAVAGQIRRLRPGLDVRVAFCEKSTPNLLDVLTGLDQPAVVAPLLLASAYHARVDIPAIIAEAGVDVLQADTLGEDPRLVQVLRHRLSEVTIDVDQAGAHTDTEAARLPDKTKFTHRFAHGAQFVAEAPSNPADQLEAVRIDGHRQQQAVQQASAVVNAFGEADNGEIQAMAGFDFEQATGGAAGHHALGPLLLHPLAVQLENLLPLAPIEGHRLDAVPSAKKALGQGHRLWVAIGVVFVVTAVDVKDSEAKTVDFGVAGWIAGDACYIVDPGSLTVAAAHM